MTEADKKTDSKTEGTLSPGLMKTKTATPLNLMAKLKGKMNVAAAAATVPIKKVTLTIDPDGTSPDVSPGSSPDSPSKKGMGKFARALKKKI